MKPLHRIALILSVPIVILSACSTSNIDPDYRLEGNEDGLVIVSISRSGLGQFHMTLHLRSGYLEFKDSSDPMAWDSPCRVGLSPNLLGQKDCTGRLAVFEMPGGEYEFHRLRAYAVLHGSRIWNITADFSAKFMVIPGRATYLGNLHFLFPDEFNSAAGIDTYHPLVRDMEERDIRLFEKHYPHIFRDKVEKTIVSFGRERRNYPVHSIFQRFNPGRG